ncbi:DUF5722 domain-containing protein [Luteolibacter luteus]|uniref:DUF5722 domain-containing protein n=1 Tax=Luteolibacter luteus TaxID=2728835 RepID=A0A858RS26_9BACT|nr:DUF5722 domain-containing protein [Luteolibacter luteus]QJE98950.1 hypothetical protein HHL09_25275 [Luteolibacter luteus]
MRSLRRCATLLLLLPSLLHADTLLKLEPFSGPDPAFLEPLPGTVELHAGMSVRATPQGQPQPGDLVLEMEYFCAGGVPGFTLLPGPPFEAKTARPSPPLGHSETWSRYAARIAPPGNPLPENWQQLRLDLPLPKDRVLQIRNARLRPETPGEFDKAAANPKSSADKDALDRYLAAKFPASVDSVSITDKEISIAGQADKEAADLFLADIPMDVVLDSPQSWEDLIPVKAGPDGRFSFSLPRHRQRGGLTYDRLSSRWQLVKKTAAGIHPLSHARYAESVAPRYPDLPPAAPKNKKGLGGWHLGWLPEELDELGISAVTVNVMIHSLVSLTPGEGTVPFQWQGRTYHAQTKALEGFDATFREAAKHNVMVSAILLVANPARDSSPVVKMLGHPDATADGTFAMPNVCSEEGISLYGAILNLMAERWSRPDGKYGRVHHWIMHNEVDAGWVWTNAGPKPDVVFMDLYQRSMRLMDLIARQYDPNSKAFITLTHHWANKGQAEWYGSKRLIDLLAMNTAAEGDFPWALAYHPYPQNLFNPRAWEDEQASFSFNSDKLTPKNLEVLDAYMKQPQLLYRGKVRPVHLSENGFNSKDYSAKELADQAAGMAMAWKKMEKLSSIESWQYHNWIDNRHEGGLKIGLRKFPDEPGDPLGKKPIWHLYKALGTPAEDSVAKPCLEVIGIKDWSEVIHQGPFAN